MTYAASVFGGYALTALAIVAYAAWVIRRGRALGRDVGIGATAASPSSSRSDPGTGQ